MSLRLTRQIEEASGLETRFTALGHVMRGGMPTAAYGFSIRTILIPAGVALTVTSNRLPGRPTTSATPRSRTAML